VSGERLTPDESVEAAAVFAALHCQAGMIWRHVAGGACRETVIADIDDLAGQLAGLRKALKGS
jgi:hypothetical protein